MAAAGIGSAVRLGVVVVLFDPTPDQRARLGLLADFGGPVVVVDNSHNPAPCTDGMDWLHNGNAGGIAGAFNRGVERLMARGASAFVLLDQDSEPPPGFFACMAAEAAVRIGRGGPAFILGPGVFDVHAQAFVPSFLLQGRGLRRVWPQHAPRQGLLPCSFVISSGSLVSRAAWETLGPWREDFVIDHVDTDYCLRAAGCGVSMFIVPTLTLRHAIGRRRVRRVLGIPLQSLNHAPARRYYMARNALALGRLHRAYPQAVAAANLWTLMQFFGVLLLESDKLRKTVALCCGLIDGLRRRSGPLDGLRPRLAKWCAEGSAESTAAGTAVRNAERTTA